MKIKKLINKRKQKKNVKSKKNQEEKVKELCRTFKENNPNASDDSVLAYAFRTVYGSKGVDILKRIKKDPDAYKEIQNDLQKNDDKIQNEKSVTEIEVE